MNEGPAQFFLYNRTAVYLSHCDSIFFFLNLRFD